MFSYARFFTIFLFAAEVVLSASFSYIGYEKVIKTDVVVRPGRITFVDVELTPSMLNMDEVVVKSGYFSETESQPVSANGFSAEEIRRAPGSAGDVSRIVMGLPSLAKVNDSKNSLIVRGGSAMENAFYLDNIEIPNINHYPTQGSTDGPIGLINVDFIKNVNFLTGGFTSAYGDKLSSVMELEFREGNRDEFDIQFDLSMQGIGTSIEGPVNGGKGSYMFSARRSYLDFIFNSVDMGSPVPKYSDFQGKVVYNISDKHKLSLLNILSSDFIKDDRNNALENESNIYPEYEGLNNTAGINWQYLWDKNGYSLFTFSHTYMNYDYNFWETATGNKLYTNESVEQQVKIRNKNNYYINTSSSLELGFELKYYFTDYDIHIAEYSDKSGNLTPELFVFKKFYAVKPSVFINYSTEPFQNLRIILGGRVDYFNYNKTTNLSPRVTAVYSLSPTTSVTGSAGIFYQTLPFILLSQDEEFKKLKNPSAVHYIAGISHLLSEDTKLTLEVYNKEYKDFPMDPKQPELFLIDNADNEALFRGHKSLTDNGKAYSRGVELLVQKKLAKQFYGLIGASYSVSKYRDLNSTWRNRISDNRFTFTIDGGYKPNESWEFSLRWIYAGGAPYTPFDETASAALSRGLYDINRVNEERLPDYHSLNIRADKRFNFDNSSLVVFLSIWNVYSRENVSAYYWNEIKNKLDTDNMWSLLPVLGIEYEL
ncbi:MAG: TonB-dependent receptor [Ignavibacteriaceae bacterium]